MRTPPMAPTETRDDAPRGAMTDRGVAALLAVTALACAPSLNGAFIWDDLTLVAPGGESARTVHGLDAFTQPFFLSADGGATVTYWRPAVALFYLALRTLFGANPAGYHAAVALAHVAAVYLASRLARRVLGERPLAVVLAVGLFALHPSRWVSVHWISGSPDPLFALAALPLLTLAVEPRDGARATAPDARTTLASIALTALALTTKETAVALPFVAAALTLATTPMARAWELLRRVARPSFACVALYVAARAAWMPVRPAGMRSPALADHVSAVLATVALQARALVWPLPLAASRDAGFLTAARHFVMPPSVIAGALAALALSALWFWRSKRARPGLVLAVGFLLPVSNLAWTGFMFLTSDRFLYLPVLGVGLAVAAELAELPPRNAWRAGVFALLAACGVTFASAAARLRDPVTFWRAEVAAMPSSSQAMELLAAELASAGRPGEAFVWRYRALRVFLDHGDDDPLVERWTLDMLVDLSSRVDDAGADALQLRDLLARFEGDSRVVRGRVGAFDVTVRRRGAQPPALAAERLALQADLASRANHDDLALAYLTDAESQCRDCPLVRVVGAMVYARIDRRDEARARCPAAAVARLDRAFQQRDSAAEMRARGNLTGATARDAEADLTLGAPERARRRLEGHPETQALTLARAHVEAEEFHFARAEALVAPLRAHPSPAVRAALVVYDDHARRRRAEAVPAGAQPALAP